MPDELRTKLTTLSCKLANMKRSQSSRQQQRPKTSQPLSPSNKEDPYRYSSLIQANEDNMGRSGTFIAQKHRMLKRKYKPPPPFEQREKFSRPPNYFLLDNPFNSKIIKQVQPLDPAPQRSQKLLSENFDVRSSTKSECNLAMSPHKQSDPSIKTYRKHLKIGGSKPLTKKRLLKIDGQNPSTRSQKERFNEDAESVAQTVRQEQSAKRLTKFNLLSNRQDKIGRNASRKGCSTYISRVKDAATTKSSLLSTKNS